MRYRLSAFALDDAKMPQKSTVAKMDVRSFFI